MTNDPQCEAPANAELKCHPLADAFPRMPQSEFAELVADVKARGLLRPVVLYEGQVLDGRHRYWACLTAGIAPRFTTYTDDDPVGLVRALNVLRRNLTASQRATAHAKLAKYEKERAAANSAANLRRGNAPRCPTSGTSGNEGENEGKRVCEIVAEQAGVSKNTAQDALTVVEHGTPELVAKVESGEVSVKAAAAEVRAAKNTPAAVRCDLGVPMDEARAEPLKRYRELHGRVSTLHRQLVEAASDLLENPLGSLFAPPAEYHTMAGSDGGTRRRMKLLEKMRELLKCSREISTCPYCRGAGCKACDHLGLTVGSTVDNAPDEHVEALRRAGEKGEPIEPLAGVARGMWEAGR